MQDEKKKQKDGGRIDGEECVNKDSKKKEKKDGGHICGEECVNERVNAEEFEGECGADGGMQGARWRGRREPRERERAAMGRRSRSRRRTCRRSDGRRERERCQSGAIAIEGLGWTSR